MIDIAKTMILNNPLGVQTTKYKQSHNKRLGNNNLTIHMKTHDAKNGIQQNH